MTPLEAAVLGLALFVAVIGLLIGLDLVVGARLVRLARRLGLDVRESDR